jgi:hypothetical protein
VTNKFAHESEVFFAAVLDHNDIRWEYEPQMLILSKDENGTVTKAFTPDFYLPDYDTYIEVTVMKKPQKKKRKIEMALRSFPGINIILICRDDIIMLEKEYKGLLNPCTA